MFGEQPQRVNVAGTEEVEVATVQGGQLRLIESLYNSEDRCVSESATR